MAAEGGRINLEWSSFQINAGEQFSHLRTSQDFVDVTLVCEDQTSFEAHRVVLAGGSSFFANILSGDQVKGHPHPLIFLRGIRGTEEMTGLLDFIYTGQAKIPEDSIQDFLTIAVSLGVKGLLPETTSSKTKTVHNFDAREIKFKDIKKENCTNLKKINECDSLEEIKEAKKVEITQDMILLVDGNFTCKVCDAEFTEKDIVSEHVKMHLEDWESGEAKRKRKRKRSKAWSFFKKNDAMTASCNLCGKDIKCKSGSTTNLHSHLQRKHGVETESTDKSVDDA